MLIKHDCTTGGERKCSKQGFISLVFQAAVFSLSITGRKRETEREGGGGQEERLLWRCGGSINQGRFELCYSIGCYPEVGWFPDPKALAYQRDCLPQSTVVSTVNHDALPFPGRGSAISKQQETIRWCCDAENSLWLHLVVRMQLTEMHSPCTKASERPRCADLRRIGEGGVVILKRMVTQQWWGCRSYSSAWPHPISYVKYARCTCTQMQPRYFCHRFSKR